MKSAVFQLFEIIFVGEKGNIMFLEKMLYRLKIKINFFLFPIRFLINRQLAYICDTLAHLNGVKYNYIYDKVY